MLDRSAVGKVSSLSTRTKWQRLPGGDTLRRVSPAGNRCHVVLLVKDETSPTADLSNIRPSQWSGLFDAPGRLTMEHSYAVIVACYCISYSVCLRIVLRYNYDEVYSS